MTKVIKPFDTYHQIYPKLKVVSSSFDNEAGAASEYEILMQELKYTATPTEFAEALVEKGFIDSYDIHLGIVFVTFDDERGQFTDSLLEFMFWFFHERDWRSFLTSIEYWKGVAKYMLEVEKHYQVSITVNEKEHAVQ